MQKRRLMNRFQVAFKSKKRYFLIKYQCACNDTVMRLNVGLLNCEMELIVDGVYSCSRLQSCRGVVGKRILIQSLRIFLSILSCSNNTVGVESLWCECRLIKCSSAQPQWHAWPSKADSHYLRLMAQNTEARALPSKSPQDI